MDYQSLSKEQQIALGQQARSILENSAFKLAIELIDNSMWNAWKDSKSDEKEARERLYQHIAVSKLFISTLNQILTNGKMHQSSLDSATIARAKGN